MCPSSIVLWCHVLLLVASSSGSLENSTSNEQRDNLTERYDLFANSMKDRDDQLQLIAYNSTTSDDDEMQYEPHINSNDSARYKYQQHIMKIHKESDQMNSAEINDDSISDRKNNSILHKLSRNFMNTDGYNNVTIVPYEACGNETCIQLCCPFGDHLSSTKKCVTGQDNYSFPDIHLKDSENKRLDELFQLTVRDPCVLQGSAHRILNHNEYSFLANGSLYRGPGEVLFSSTSYCLGILDRNIYDVIVCMKQIGFPVYMSVCLLLSLPFLLTTFVVYTILPELQHVHSYTLRVHCASLFISNVIIFCVQEIPELSEWKYCLPLAYIFNFSMLSSCFWLNIICFDIWWTFRKLDLQHTSEKKKKKRFMIYSIYAWGITFAFTVTCAIMDHVPGIPKHLIRPGMCTKKFWISHSGAAFSVYFYGPTGTAFLVNIGLFIITAISILYHNKHTAHQLRDSESRNYARKKRKFAMYLKLFIVMGVSWGTGIILWLLNTNDSIPQFVWNVSYTIDILQGVITFFIYVCNKKILRLLLKRFGWQDRIWKTTVSNDTRTSSQTSNLSSTSDLAMQKVNSSLNISEQTNNHVETSAV